MILLLHHCYVYIKLVKNTSLLTNPKYNPTHINQKETLHFYNEVSHKLHNMSWASYWYSVQCRSLVILHRYTEVELQLFLRTAECRISWQNGPSARTAACCKTHSLAHSVAHTSLSGWREDFHVTICFILWGIGYFGQYINHYKVAESHSVSSI